MGNEHKVNMTEHPTHKGELRIELNCPSGCFKGYLWGQPEIMRPLAELVANGHEAATMSPR